MLPGQQPQHCGASTALSQGCSCKSILEEATLELLLEELTEWKQAAYFGEEAGGFIGMYEQHLWKEEVELLMAEISLFSLWWENFCPIHYSLVLYNQEGMCLVIPYWNGRIPDLIQDLRMLDIMYTVRNLSVCTGIQGSVRNTTSFKIFFFMWEMWIKYNYRKAVRK